jgi:hypothetical protein
MNYEKDDFSMNWKRFQKLQIPVFFQKKKIDKNA